MIIDLKAQTQGKKTSLVAINATEYQETTLGLVKQLSDNHSRILYISLNTLMTPLRHQFEDHGIDLKKFYFIDGVTKTVIPSPPEFPNTIFVPSPDALTKLSIAVTTALQSFDPDIIYFESLSTLLIYEDVMAISQFVHLLVNKITAYGSRAIFTCLKGEKEQQLIKNLSLSLDKIIE
jgi:archaellum biogenesis ATPase FlaH